MWISFNFLPLSIHRNHQRAVKVLMAAVADDPQRLQLATEFSTRFAVALRQPVLQRSIRTAELELLDQVHVVQAALFQIIQRLRALQQRLVVVVDHLVQQYAVIAGQIHVELVCGAASEILTFSQGSNTE